MRFLGNILWLVCGGACSAAGYFTGAIALCLTIIGIPFGIQVAKLGLLCLWPFGATINVGDYPPGCIRIPMNLIWFIFGGFLCVLSHLLFCILLCLTIIGIPFGKQHFKMAELALAPFGRDIHINF
ncbi:MAG: YccF domain-containing protein [Bacteroidales bacterium]|nr:YccF domain-containing protein [Bacteroidales bacterium]